jgi:endonuclease/exonuclease/phosphatase family metal-dependent hydrolase
MTHIRVASYNIHKGVQGLGPRRRLEIHNLGHAIEQFDADLVCLQEVRKMHRREAQYFARWPELPQAEFLAPQGYEAVYRTNAVTRHGEHGNALLSRWPVQQHQHEDMSDHRFEQRGLVQAVVQVHEVDVHVIVLHLGLIRSSRIRQLAQVVRFITREIPAAAPVLVAGDLNDFGATLWHALEPCGLREFKQAGMATFPSRLPLLQLDHVFARGLVPVGLEVPRGRIWSQMSDHLPLIADFEITQAGA